VIDMKSKIVIVLALFLIALMPGALPAAQATTSTTGEIDPPTRANILEAYASLPLLFIRNQGQIDSHVEYYVKAAGQTVYLTASGMVFDLIRYRDTAAADSADRKAGRLAFSLDFVGANASPLIQGGDKDKAVVNYLIGNDPREWHTDIPTCREVVYQDVYPGIGLRLYGKEGALEYEFVVQPGADVSDIALAYTGVDSLDMESGELVAGAAFGDIKQSRPYIYQQIGDDQVAIAGGFKLLGANSYGFEIASYDTGYPLVIDPSLLLAYSTYLGGSADDSGYGIAVESGYAYITGYTASTNFPIQNQYQTDNTTTDAFVTKLDTSQIDNPSLIYSTYLGGNGNDYGYGIAVESGCAYVTGSTTSTDFPRVNWYQSDNTTTDAFVTRLNTAGNSATYSTYLGGNQEDWGQAIAVESGSAYVTGYTKSTNFPALHQYQTNIDNTTWAVFMTRIDTTQSAAASLIYSTCLNGSSNDYGYGIAVESGCAYVTGSTYSNDFPTRHQYQNHQANYDAFVAKFDTSQSEDASLIYSTCLGGTSSDQGRAIAVESGCAYVTGETNSSNFPTLYQYQSDNTSTDAFVSKLNTIGDNITYSTYLGGGDVDYGQGIAVESGCAYITGKTDSSDFPILYQYQSDNTTTDAFVTKIDTTKSGVASLIYSTYLGGSGIDSGNGIAVESGCAYVTGTTASTNFPTLNQYQADPGDSLQDAFVSKLCFSGISITSPDGGESWAAGSSQAITWTSIAVTDNVDILISRNSGASYASLIANTTNDGSEGWTVIGPATTQARIRVRSHGDQAVNDASNADFTITCAEPSPGAPTLSSPADGARVSGTSVTLQWIKGTGTPTDYQLKVNSSAGMNGTSYFDGSVGNVLSKVVSGLPNNGSTIYWTVGASNACGYSPWATMRSFTNSPNCAGDYTGDGKADYAVYRPSSGKWYVYGSTSYPAWGLSGDIPVPADYNGDGKTEYAVYRPGDGKWYVYGSASYPAWGLSGDVPVPADYNGDGKAEFAVYRPSDGKWYVYGSASYPAWGLSGDVPVPADYNGDGKAEFAVWRPSDGKWYVYGSASYPAWGLAGDKLVPADYNGDGKAEFAVWRPSDGKWYVYGSASYPAWGLAGDTLVPADYNGDGKAEYAVWRPSNGTWYVYGSGSYPAWGLATDVPAIR
jgi:hypothetical protein